MDKHIRTDNKKKKSKGGGKYIGLIAGVLTTGAFIPQVFKVYRTKSAKGLSLATLVIFFIGQILWFVHGMQIKDASIIIFPFISNILYAYLLYAKLTYVK